MPTPDQAFERLYGEHRHDVYRYALSILRRDDDAADATQRAFEKALNALRDNRGPATNERAWLFAITYNSALDVNRQRRVFSELDENTATDSSAFDEAWQREEIAQVLADVAALPDDQRGAIVMREMIGLTSAEVGEALGVDETAVRGLLRDARVALRAYESGRLESCDDIRERLCDRRAARNRLVQAHLRWCKPCQVWDERRRRFALFLPLFPSALDQRIRAGITQAGWSATAIVSIVGLLLAGTAGALAIANSAGTRPSQPPPPSPVSAAFTEEDLKLPKAPKAERPAIDTATAAASATPGGVSRFSARQAAAAEPAPTPPADDQAIVLPADAIGKDPLVSAPTAVPELPDEPASRAVVIPSVAPPAAPPPSVDAPLPEIPSAPAPATEPPPPIGGDDVATPEDPGSPPRTPIAGTPVTEVPPPDSNSNDEPIEISPSQVVDLPQAEQAPGRGVDQP